MLEHKHLILKGSITQPKNTTAIADALTEIVALVGMRVLAPANVVYCTEPDNVGNTGVILLTTSHMVWHDWEDKFFSRLQFDLYSCAGFDPDDVVKYLIENFELRSYRWSLFDRDHEIIETNYGPKITPIAEPAFWNLSKGK